MIRLISFLLPAIIDVVNRFIKDKQGRFWMSVLICSIVGTFIAFIDTNGFEGYKRMMDYAETIGNRILETFGLAQLVYHAWYSDSAIQEAIRGDEAMKLKDKQD